MPARKPQTFTLPAPIARDLAAWCEGTGDDPSAVIADLVDAFLDDLAAEAETLGLADVPPPPSAGRGLEGFACSRAADNLRKLMAARRRLRSAPS